MSFVTGTQTEALSANSAVGSAYNTSTTATVVSPATGAAWIPANFVQPSYGSSKALLVKAYGVLSTTSTPNLTMEVLANTTQGTRNSSGILATTGTLAQGSGVTNVPWELEVLITAATTGASASFLGMGMFKVYNSATTLNTARCSSSAANPNTGLTLSSQSAYYIEVAATWGTNSASNTLTVYGYTVLGLN